MEKTIMPAPVSGSPKKEKYIAPRARIHTKVAVKVLCQSQLQDYNGNSWDEDEQQKQNTLSSYDGVAF